MGTSGQPSGGISLGSVATIPVLPDTVAVTSMIVNNNTGTNLTLTGAYIVQNDVTTNALRNYTSVDVKQCKTLVSNSSCEVIIAPPELSGNFIINLIFADNQGKHYSGSQIINYTSQVKQENGFVSFAPENLPFIFEGRHTISFPVILENNYSKLSAHTQNFPGAVSRLKCLDDNYTAGNMCTIYVTYSGSNSESEAQNIVAANPELIINGNLNKPLIQNKLSVATDILTQNISIAACYNYKQSCTVATQTAGNLVVSAPNIQVTAGSPTTVTLLNNGNATVTGISYNGLTPLSATSSGGTCGTSLAAGISCTFKVSLTSATSSNSSNVIIMYTNGNGQTQSLSFNVYYHPAATTPALALSNHSWFVDTLVNSVNYQGIYVANTGTATLNNVQFSNISGEVANMSYGGVGQTCVSGQSLTPGSSCILIIYYSPNAAVALSISTQVKIAATATYTDQGGNINNVVSNGITMQYSANAPGVNLGSYVVAGDYGAISANISGAVISGITGWAVENNTPFTSAACTIIRMVNNGDLQIAGMNGAAACDGFIYTANKGMIWQSASGGTNAPPTGVVADAITGLTYDSTNGYLVSNAAAGNLYSTSSITGVTPTWNTALTSAFNVAPVNLYNFGTASVYIAPQATVTTNKQFAVSTVSTTTVAWTQVNPTPLLTFLAATYDGTYYCLLAQTSHVTCATTALTTNGSWVENTTAMATLGNAIYMTNNGSSSYVALVTTTPFVIFTTSRPASASAWTHATTGPTAALAWVTYGGGQYVAVSNATPGLIWTSPNGNIWTQQASGAASSATTPPNNPTSEPYTFVYYDQNNYWASGARLLKVSPDGINWSNAGVRGLTYLYNGTTLTYLAAGTSGAIETSTNLTSWTAATSGTESQINSIKCFNSTNCLAVGNNGMILFSSDGGGANWSVQNSNITNNLNSVACGYSNCVVVGNSGLILTQAIATTSWTAQTVGGGTNNLNSVIFNNVFNSYIAVGNGGIIYTSTDGVKWVSQTSNTSNNLKSVYCAYSVLGCMAVGDVSGSSTTGTVVTSLSGISWTVQTVTTGSNLGVSFYNGNWVVVQTATAIGGTIRSTADIATPAWTAAKTANISDSATTNFNTILAY